MIKVCSLTAVEIEGERIISVVKRSEAPKSNAGGPVVLDYGNAVIMPGLIDAYVPYPSCLTSTADLLKI